MGRTAILDSGARVGLTLHDLMVSGRSQLNSWLATSYILNSPLSPRSPGTTNYGEGGPCLAGHYCPAGCAEEDGLACQTGTWNPNEMMEECQVK